MTSQTPLGHFLGALLLIGTSLFAQLALADHPALLSEEERAWIVENPIVVVGVRTNVAPLEYVENGQLKGLSAEYLKAVSRLTGLKFKTKEISDASTYQSKWLADGVVDMVALAARNIQPTSGASDSLFTAPYYVSATIIVTRARAPIMMDRGELDGRTVAVPRHSPYEAKFREVLPGAKFVSGDGAEGTLEMVATGRADAAIALDGFLSPVLSSRYNGLLQISGVISSGFAELSMSVSKNRPMLYSIIQKALQQITAEESYRMNEAWLEQARFGEPSLEVLVRHYGPQGLMLTGVFLLLGGLAYAWRREHLRAVKGEAEKAMFLAVMSHEIRSPMNAVLASVELLQRTPLDDVQQRLLGLACQGGESLLRLLNDVLDVSKLEAGKLVLEYEPADIVALVREVLDSLRKQAEEMGVELVFAVPDPIGFLMLDTSRTAQILQNLVSHAIGSTPRGSVTVKVTISLAEDSASGGVLRIEVSDTGSGIDGQGYFQSFLSNAQRRRSMRGRLGGAGLGLLLCRELISRMNGDIMVGSVPGAGTTVALSLPVRRVTENDGAAAQSEIPVRRPEVGHPVILLVEDTPANQFLIQAQLERLGCKFRMAANGEEARLAFEQETYDLILLDCNLPDTDGYRLAQQFRVEEVKLGARRCAIIAISAITGSAHALRCLNAGMDGVLSKPISLAKLQSTIENFCGVLLTESTDASNTRGCAAQAMDSGVALSLVQDDLRLLDAAVAQADFARAKHHAHRVLGASMSLGLSALTGLAKGLEDLLEAGHDMDAEDVYQVLKDAKLELERLIAADKGFH